ncbi:MAG: hypothetical protein IPM24_08760 [Bryobacterales bacterium]|nr:hypothetical protein [Bryobacterales bacterium]
MAELHCLYCEKPLGLVARLSGGEFCGREHRDLYQQEHTKLALARLMQAQPSASRAPEPVGLPVNDPPPAGMVGDRTPPAATGFGSPMAAEVDRWLLPQPPLGSRLQGIGFVSPGAFLRRDVQPESVPGPQWRLEAVAFAPPEPKQGYLDERLRRCGQVNAHAA